MTATFNPTGNTYSTKSTTVGTGPYIATVAGSFNPNGTLTEGEPAAAATLQPSFVAVDSAGDVYVDNSGSFISKIDPAGNITTFYSQGSDYLGDIAVDSAGNLFIADGTAGRIVKVTPAGNSSDVATGLSSPATVAVDAQGDLFVTDIDGTVVQELKYASGVYGSPATIVEESNVLAGMATDAAGNLYIADPEDNCIFERTTPPHPPGQ